MDFNSIPYELIAGQGVFGVLFIWLLLTTMKRAEQREDKLIAQIEKQNESQSRIVKAVERLEKQISTLKSKF
ncbi:BhlA/UviB family holin-like peptide [Priestia filamentosa]|uniref:BhlA/UviB family holin-like peptide n=1 Tax=Priestia filamentosa TaxID=1402861 RepID=UPI000A08878A|nr:BhlA/UviB family holin-like peptide [Priestia filamentosa]OXS67232.1 holin [Priestia filamentosa]SMF53499.1 BhlA holin family protein [Priestia filamentosa]